MHHHVSLEIPLTLHRCGQYHNKPSTPSPPQHLRRVYFGPRHRLRFASQLRERRRGLWRSSWIGFQAVLRSPQRPPLAHPFQASSSFVGPLFSQSRRRSTAAELETVDHPSDYGFSCQYLWLHFQDNRTPHCRANPATRASSSPDLRDQGSIFTRVSSSPELHDLSFTT